jgi:hypothetical protein
MKKKRAQDHTAQVLELRTTTMVNPVKRSRLSMAVTHSRMRVSTDSHNSLTIHRSKIRERVKVACSES